MIVEKLEPIPEIDQLIQEVSKLVEKHGIKNNQLMLQGIEPEIEDWEQGIGSLYNLKIKTEASYKHIFPSIRDSVLAHYINRYKGFRTRIMNMNPRSCYSVHSDPTPRIHIPIKTNDQTWMVWPKHNQCHQMAVGSSYFTDTTLPHTFMNCSLEQRIHIVICIDNKPKL
jgi:hypothetical protein